MIAADGVPVFRERPHSEDGASPEPARRLSYGTVVTLDPASYHRQSRSLHYWGQISAPDTLKGMWLCEMTETGEPTLSWTGFGKRALAADGTQLISKEGKGRAADARAVIDKMFCPLWTCYDYFTRAMKPRANAGWHRLQARAPGAD